MTPAKPVLTLGNKNYSSWSLRPWLVLKAHGVDFDERVLPLETEAFGAVRAHSPSGRVPALEHDGLTVWDSLAIAEYADEVFLARRGWPAGRAARAVARSIVAEMHSGFQALRSECPMNVRRRLERPLPLSPAAEADVVRVKALWRDARARFGAGGPWLFGEFSIADAFYAPVATRFHTYRVPLGAVEQAWVDAMLDHPAMREWLDDARREPWTIDKYERVGA